MSMRQAGQQNAQSISPDAALVRFENTKHKYYKP